MPGLILPNKEIKHHLTNICKHPEFFKCMDEMVQVTCKSILQQLLVTLGLSPKKSSVHNTNLMLGFMKGSSIQGDLPLLRQVDADNLSINLVATENLLLV